MPMKHLLIIIVLLAAILSSGCLGETSPPVFPSAPAKYACETDADCDSGGECCHPTGCVNAEWGRDYRDASCLNAECTEECTDCPICECVNNACTKTGEVTVDEGACC